MRHIKYFNLIIYSLFIFSANAQQSLSLRMGLDICGCTQGYHFLQESNVLQKSGGAIQAAVPIRLQYRFHQNFGIELGYQFTRYSLEVGDSKYKKANGKPDGDADDYITPVLNGSRMYQSPSLALYTYLPIGDNYANDAFFYLGAGVLFNHRVNGATDSYNYIDADSDKYTLSATYNKLNLISQFSSYFPSGFIEAGITCCRNENANVLYIGCKYTFAPQMMQADYTVVNKNQSIISTDHLSANGTYWSFTIQYGGNLWYKKSKKPKPPRTDIIAPDFFDFEKDSLVAQKAEHDSAEVHRKQAEQTAAIKAMGDRPFATTNKINVHAQKISIKVWDDEVIDGDIISLNLNGEWILKNYTLKAQKNTIEISLNLGENNLVFYAESEGRKKPCTVAVSFDDGHKTEKLIIDSDLKKSSCVKINYVP